MKKYNVAVVGATGLVGRTFLRVMEEYSFPVDGVKLFASERSVGSKVPFFAKEYAILPLEKDLCNGVDVAFFSAGSEVSDKFAPVFVANGALVIDNSSRWRMDDGIPLIVPEINADDYSGGGIIANPNCGVIQCVLPLFPLKKYGLKRVTYVTFQAVSGSGMKGIEDLKRAKNGGKCVFYPYDISLTCIPEIGSPVSGGYTSEEKKMADETRKILHLPDLKVSATCVRVPVENCHGVCVSAEFERRVSPSVAREEIKRQAGVEVIDDVSAGKYPVSTLTAGKDEVFVGRIREDPSCENGIVFWCVADNVRKGAASNAVQIAALLAEKGMIRRGQSR
ncbi:MAG: aspartate-semialdehyde dehydrogenase [Clostridia bacterium]|nr:aspartate-semialdehyde dehydrogenase [Clostridia bacterium]